MKFRVNLLAIALSVIVFQPVIQSATPKEIVSVESPEQKTKLKYIKKAFNPRNIAKKIKEEMPSALFRAAVGTPWVSSSSTPLPPT